MAKLPGAEAFGERPAPTMPRRTPMVATLRPTSGFEESTTQELGRSSAQLEQAERIAIQAKDQQDNLRAEDAVNQLRAKQVDMTFGKDGFANLRGGDAVNKPILKTYGGAFDQAAADLSGTLENDFQRQLFQRRAAVAGMQLREDIGRHILQEGKVYAETVYNAKLDVEAKAAASRWQTPDASTVPMLNIENMINQRARYLGLDGQEASAWAQDQKQKAESKVYTNMVKQALVSDPATGPFAARALLKAHGDVINPDMRAVLEHEVSLAARPVEARTDAIGAVQDIVPKVAESLEISGQPALSKLSAEEARSVGSFIGDKRTLDAAGKLVILRDQLKDENRDKSYDGELQKDIARLEGQVGRRIPTGTKVDTMALLGDAIAAGRARAAKTHPDDPVYADMVEQQIKSQFGTIAAVQQGQQKQNYQTLVKAMMPQEGGGPVPTTQEQLFANPANRAAFYALDQSQQSGILAHLAHNLSASLGHPMKEDGKIISDLSARVFLPSGDPNKITNIGQLIPYLNQGVGTGGFGFLSGLIDKSQSITGGRFSQDMNRVAQTARSMLRSSTIGSVQPEVAEEAAYHFARDLDAKIDEYQKGGKDVRVLFTPGTPEYVLAPAKVMGYMTTSPSAAVAAEAGKAPAPSPQTSQGAVGGPPAVRSPAAPGYEIGKIYTFKQGKFEYLGGDPASPASFRAVK